MICSSSMEDIIKIGKLECIPLSDGKFWLDGGAMFGVVPKIFWQKTNPSDEKNRIILGLHPLLIKHPEKNILIDTGIGNKFDEKLKGIYGVDKSENLEDSLKKYGLKTTDIDTVIITHLHFDHAGGNTYLTAEGETVPKFPNATYIVQKKEWEGAINPNPRSKASYLEENFMPLEYHNQLRLIDGDVEIFPYITCIRTGGHTEGHQIVIIEEGDQGAIYWADLIPTTSHIRIPYIMGYDLFPLDVFREKERFIKRAIEMGWISFFEHDPNYTSGYILLEEGKPKFISREA
ncbi:MBL fold metallo-hydrolase [candidate division WOR-3 bacterium]|nr:MBL fold metallo-hydrolase [candidate division WOR-3 bacterium]